MRSRSLIAVLALAAGLGLSACGGGGGETGSGDTGLGSTDFVDTGFVDTGVTEEPLPETTPPLAEPAIQIEIPRAGEAIGPQSPSAKIIQLQKALKALGFKIGPADGQYGPKTTKAIKKFQKQRGLEVDGLVGPRTAREINKALQELAAQGA